MEPGEWKVWKPARSRRLQLLKYAIILEAPVLLGLGLVLLGRHGSADRRTRHGSANQTTPAF